MTRRRTVMAEHEAAAVLAVVVVAWRHALARAAVHSRRAPRVAARRHRRAHRIVAGLSRARLLGCLRFTTSGAIHVSRTAGGLMRMYHASLKAR